MALVSAKVEYAAEPDSKPIAEGSRGGKGSTKALYCYDGTHAKFKVHCALEGRNMVDVLDEILTAHMDFGN